MAKGNTDLGKLKELRHELLVKMEADFREELIPAVLAEEAEGQPEILTVLFDSLAKEGAGAEGEFLFMPAAEDDELQYFTSIPSRQGCMYEARAKLVRHPTFTP